jgi:C1A family cysteine protease
VQLFAAPPNPAELYSRRHPRVCLFLEEAEVSKMKILRKIAVPARFKPTNRQLLRCACTLLAIVLAAIAVSAQQAATNTNVTNPDQKQIVQPVRLGPDELRSAPRNPEFVKYIESMRAGNAPMMQTLQGHALGYIPEPVDLSHLKKQSTISPFTMAAFPASYDLRTKNKMTPVRDQSSCGSCWAFGTYGSAESVLRPTESRDWSENNLKNLAGFDNTPCQGGNFIMSSAYLARWSGPVTETADPYKATDDRTTSPANAPVMKREMQIVFIPGRNSATDNDQIKAALMNRGAVAVSMWMDESTAYLNTATSSYYLYNTVGTTNHAVTVAGWDDNYSRNNFIQVPPGDGAFLVKNSWGTGWGNAGYFWVSYYSADFIEGWAASFGGAVPTTTYSHKYEYDPFGWVDSINVGSNMIYYANIYTATEPGYLDAVSTYIAANNSPYTLKVYKGVTPGNPVSGTLVSSDSGIATYAGYQMFSVNPSHLVTGDKFSVVMQLTTPGYDFPGPVQEEYDGYSTKATGAAGHSFYSGDGVNWGDIYLDMQAYLGFNGGAASLKAFTTADTATPTTKPTFSPAAGSYTTWQDVTLTATAGATIYYTVDGSSPNIFSSVYSSPISVRANTTIKAIATTAGHSTSAVSLANYTITLPAAAAPTIKPGGGTYGVVKVVTLAPVTAGTTVYYTLDGSKPTTESTLYTAPLQVTTSETIKAIAASAEWGPSPVATAVYKLLPSPQTFTGLATSLTTTTATINATANNFNGSAQFWFQWGTTTAMGNATAKTTLPASTATQNISAPLSALTTKTTYYFRPVISSVGGMTYGATQTFTTK